MKHLKQLKPTQWWREVKRMFRMRSTSSSANLFHLQIENQDNLSPSNLANLINNSFLGPMKEFRTLNTEEFSVATLVVNT